MRSLWYFTINRILKNQSCANKEILIIIFSHFGSNEIWIELKTVVVAKFWLRLIQIEGDHSGEREGR